MLFAIVLVLALQNVPPGPAASAQCLVEVAALSGERLNILDARGRSAASAKAASLYQAQLRLLAARVDLIASHESALESVRADEAESTVPPGTTEVARLEFDRDLREIDDTLEAVRLRAPSCDWPRASR